MKKTISIICVIGALLIILDSVSASHWFILLLLAGIIPGTDILIAPVDMMAANATAITVVIMRITMGSALTSFFFDRFKTTSTKTKRYNSRQAV